jgi:Mg/Co/Ni transporter MgtE
LFTPEFWRDAAERAVRTAAQTGLALVTATAGLGLTDIDWAATASIVGLATLASVLTSVATSGVGPTGTASVVTEPATA